MYSHSTIGKNDRDANLLRSSHVQGPKQRHRHKQEHEIRKDVTEPKDVFDIVGLGFAHRRGRDTQFEIERGGQWLAGEADQEDAHDGPDSHDGADCPRRVAELRVDLEYTVKEDQDGEFGNGNRDDVK